MGQSQAEDVADDEGCDLDVPDGVGAEDLEVDADHRPQDLGEHRLKDLSEPQRLFQLCGDGLRTSFPPLKTLGGYFTNLPVQPNTAVWPRT